MGTASAPVESARPEPEKKPYRRRTDDEMPPAPPIQMRRTLAELKREGVEVFEDAWAEGMKRIRWRRFPRMVAAEWREVMADTKRGWEACWLGLPASSPEIALMECQLIELAELGFLEP